MGGHLLITTRASATGQLAQRIEVQSFTEEDGALLLLRRAALLAPDKPLSQASEQNQEIAKTISRELGGLPLALDQAGAYLEQTGCGLANYQQLYQSHQNDLLKKRGGIATNHPDPVTTTWQLSFAKVEQQNPVAANLLRFCAFLAADAIPQALLIAGDQPVVKDLWELQEAIETLRAYSLISYDAAPQTLSLHRLVQVVTRNALSKEEQRTWMKRAIASVTATFPDPKDVTRWSACEQWLPHALVCVTWIEQEQLDSTENTRLLNEAGYYLRERARFAEAEPLFLRALTIREQQLGLLHSDTAASLNNLASLYQVQGKFSDAEPLFQRSLAIHEQTLGPDHPHTARSLNNLAALYRDQGKLADAAPLFQRALAICEQALGKKHPTTQLVRKNYTTLLQMIEETSREEEKAPD